LQKAGSSEEAQGKSTKLTSFINRVLAGSNSCMRRRGAQKSWRREAGRGAEHLGWGSLREA